MLQQQEKAFQIICFWISGDSIHSSLQNNIWDKGLLLTHIDGFVD
jgi:hypothetical protein